MFIFHLPGFSLFVTSLTLFILQNLFSCHGIQTPLTTLACVIFGLPLARFYKLLNSCVSIRDKQKILMISSLISSSKITHTGTSRSKLTINCSGISNNITRLSKTTSLAPISYSKQNKPTFSYFHKTFPNIVIV